VPKRKNTFSSWRRRAVQRAVHAGWAWVQRTGSVTAEHPGRFRFGALGRGTRLAFPLGTVFGEPWIQLGAHCIVGEQVTLTAGLMPDLDLGPDPILRIGDGVVLGRGSHVIADTTVTIGSDCYFGPYVYVTSTNHSYDDPHEPIGKQWPRMEPVEIGPGCWIGTGAVILPGARIGRNVVVAAGAGRTALDVRRRLAAAAEDPGTGADPRGRHPRTTAGAGPLDRGGRGPARRTGRRRLDRVPPVTCLVGRPGKSRTAIRHVGRWLRWPRRRAYRH
jgi:serine acetyltransferase